MTNKTLKYIIPSILLMGSPLTMGITEEPKLPLLSLEQEIYLTNKVGVANPNSVIRLKPRDNIIIYLTDGTVLKGIVTKTEDINKEIFKVFGDIQNKENTGFGFVLTKDGIFAGAVVCRNEDITYVLKYSKEAEGFIFFKTLNMKLIADAKNSSETH